LWRDASRLQEECRHIEADMASVNEVRRQAQHALGNATRW